MNWRSRHKVAATLSVAWVHAFWACSSPDGGDPADGSASGAVGGIQQPGDGDGDGDATGSGGDKGDGASSSGGEASVGELKLVAQYPESGDEQANALLPIELTFSQAVDEESAQDAIHLQVGAERIPVTVTVDKKKVRLTIDELPVLPARLNLVVGNALMSVDGAHYVGDSWSFSYPLWQTPGGTAPKSDGPFVFSDVGDGDLMVVSVVDGALSVQLGQHESWFELPRPTEAPASPLGLVVAPSGPTLVWQEQRTIHAASYSSDEWNATGGEITLDDGSVSSVGKTPDGDLLVATTSGSMVRIYELIAGRFEALPDLDVAFDVTELSVTATVDGTFVATVTDELDIAVWGFDGQAWTATGQGIDRVRTTGPVRPALHGQDRLFLAYLDGDARSNNVQVAIFEDAWQPFGPTLDLEVDGESSLVAMELYDGRPTVAWVEKEFGPRRVLVASAESSTFRVLGQAAMQGVAAETTQLALSFHEDGFPEVALLEGDHLALRRFNASPGLPVALSSRGDIGDCSIPEDDADFPQTLSETGCYADLRSGKLISGAIPYNINSILWSDGADKRRFAVIPEGEHVTYTENGALGFPVGSLLIKEFLIERTAGNPDSLAHMETRFLIKRCEESDSACAVPWQGYSYQWNDEGTDGDLLPESADAFYKDWNVTKDGVPSTHTHLYPSRTQCLNCHLYQVGGVNGLQAAQLNRPQSYGDFIDNQLRVWEQIDLFEGTIPSDPPEQRGRIPIPADVGQSYEERAAGYLHANCSHCHQPKGARPSTDFRYSGPGLSSLVCKTVAVGAYQGSAYIVPGHVGQSLIYERTSARDGDGKPSGLQMPPLGTLLPDGGLLSILSAYIGSLPDSCN